MKEASLELYRNYSDHFWKHFIQKSSDFLGHIPKNLSVSTSYDINGECHSESTLPEIEHTENILMRVRIFMSESSDLNVWKILNSLSRDYPNLRNKIDIIKSHKQKLKGKNTQCLYIINNKEYEKIETIINYILNGALLHTDKDKKNDYHNLFQTDTTISETLHLEIVRWVIHYIRYVLFEIDALLKQEVYDEKKLRKELLEKLNMHLKFI